MVKKMIIITRCWAIPSCGHGLFKTVMEFLLRNTKDMTVDPPAFGNFRFLKLYRRETFFGWSHLIKIILRIEKCLTWEILLSRTGKLRSSIWFDVDGARVNNHTTTASKGWKGTTDAHQTSPIYTSTLAILVYPWCPELEKKLIVTQQNPPRNVKFATWSTSAAYSSCIL